MVVTAILMVAAVLVGLMAVTGMLGTVIACVLWPLGWLAGAVFQGLVSGFWRGRNL